MIIIWGTRLKRKNLGRVADFCPYCRAFRILDLIRVGAARHLYWISVGSGSWVGHELVCQDCRVCYPGDDEDYHEPTKDRGADLERVIELTNPDIDKHWSGRLEKERRLQAGALEPHERAELLREPFELLDPQVEARCKQIHIDGLSVLAVLMMFLLPAVFVAATPLVMSMWDNAELLLGMNAGFVLGMAGLGVGLGLTIWSVATDASRFAHRQLMRFVIKALQPLAPTLEELELALRELKAEDYFIGGKMKARRVHEAVHRSSPQAGNHLTRSRSRSSSGR